MAYIGQEPGLGVAERYIFTASGGETTITADDDGLSIGYTVNQVSVYLNGVKLVLGTDFTATNGSTITGLSALTASDVVEVIALSTFSPADTVPATGGTFTGAVTASAGVVGNLTGNASGTSATVTTAAQPAITSVGTLTGLTSASLVLTPTATGSAPSASDGKLYFDSTKDALMVSDGSIWKPVNTIVTTTGGTITSYVGYHIHSFLSEGSTTFTVTGGSLVCDILLVAGGGGVAAAEGASGSTGGGGAGGLVEITGLTVEPGAYTIVVGAGGAGSSNHSLPASQGGSSTGFGYTATGGGAGPDYGTTGGTGGSGAGGSENVTPAGPSNQNTYSSDAIAVGYGNAGSNGGSYPGGNAGGGGGAGGAGSGQGSGSAGAGRNNNWRTGSNVTYSAGGEGGRDNVNGTAGLTNTGNGAKGDSTTSGNKSTAYAGGSGIVIIRCAN